jgi:DNA mismatch repair protein MutS
LNGGERVQSSSRGKKRKQGDIQLTLFAPMEHPLMDEIRAANIDELTPLGALQLIQQWKAQLDGEPTGKPR